MKRRQLYQSLKNKHDISHLYKEGKNLYSDDIMLRYRTPDSHSDSLMVLFAIPSKIKPIVRKNRYRRIVKESLFLVLKDGSLHQEIEHLKQFHISLMPKESFNLLSLDERCQQIEELLIKMNRWIKERESYAILYYFYWGSIKGFWALFLGINVVSIQLVQNIPTWFLIITQCIEPFWLP